MSSEESIVQNPLLRSSVDRFDGFGSVELYAHVVDLFQNAIGLLNSDVVVVNVIPEAGDAVQNARADERSLALEVPPADHVTDHVEMDKPAFLRHPNAKSSGDVVRTLEDEGDLLRREKIDRRRSFAVLREDAANVV